MVIKKTTEEDTNEKEKDVKAQFLKVTSIEFTTGSTWYAVKFFYQNPAAFE